MWATDFFKSGLWANSFWVSDTDGDGDSDGAPASVFLLFGRGRPRRA